MNDSYCLLPVSFHLKIISLISLYLISLFSFWKCTQEKILVPFILNSQKIKQEMGVLLVPKNPTRRKFNLNPVFNYSRKMKWNNSKKDSNSIFAKKKKKHSRQLEIMLLTMLKTLDLFLYWNSLLTTMDQELANCNKVYDIATYSRRITMLTNLPTFKFDCSPQKRLKQRNKSPISSILWTTSKNCPKFWETLCLLRFVMHIKLCYFFKFCNLIIHPQNLFSVCFGVEQFDFFILFLKKSPKKFH